ncbi:MAG: alanine dehydrogenase, partial [Aquiluna sp.]|nr:alanine dehydrogenase [Aquiluna sp.]
MLVGVPKEIKNNENRVAMTPAGVHELTARGHQVLIEAGAGVGSGFEDSEYVAAGAALAASAQEVWSKAEMIVKVKEPIAPEYSLMRKGQILFTYLHLAASKDCTDAIVKSETTAIAYETVQLPNRSLPLLHPMSEVAGRLSAQIGANQLMKFNGGTGVLMGGV